MAGPDPVFGPPHHGGVDRVVVQLQDFVDLVPEEPQVERDRDDDEQQRGVRRADRQAGQERDPPIPTLEGSERRNAVRVVGVSPPPHRVPSLPTDRDRTTTRQAEAASDSFGWVGSIRRLGPIVEESARLLMYLPLAAEGFA